MSWLREWQTKFSWNKATFHKGRNPSYIIGWHPCNFSIIKEIEESMKIYIYIYIYWPRKQHDDYNMHVQKSSKFHEHAMIAHIDIHYSMSGCSFSGFARYGWYYY